MANRTFFSEERRIYWLEEFSDIVNELTGRDENGRTILPPLYQYNTGVITLAACLGVKNARKRGLDSSARRKEISTGTFASHGLEAYIFMVPLLSNHPLGIDILRPEHEEAAIHEFEEYACGGLEMLRGIYDQSAGKSPDALLQSIITKKQDQEPLEIPSLFEV